MNTPPTVLSYLVEHRDRLVAYLESHAAAQARHLFEPVTQYYTDPYGFSAVHIDIDGDLGCNNCGASRFNPSLHIE